MRLQNWYNNLIMEVKVDPHPKARKYSRKYELNTDIATKNQLKNGYINIRNLERSLLN